ncbi:MAG TPA: RluA family pseudouridine synthase [Planctomycetota bacterium]|nr:RluA family pseudouridine synthase [Planctomycetota bacterium]
MSESSRPIRTFSVPPEHAGSRLDRCLAALLAGTSRTRIQAWIEQGAVRVDGAVPTKSGVLVAAGACIEVELRESDAQRVEPADAFALTTLFADEHILVVDKPAGMLAHPTATLRGATVSEVAEEEFGPLPSQQGRDRPGIVHRLDAGTSGVMVLARTEAASAELLRQFRARTVVKTYSAIVHNEPRFDSDWIQAALDRNPKAPQKRIVVPDGTGRAASTFYFVRERLRGFALLDCQPKTGRTHQIRAHLAHIGLPIVGDRMYKHHGPLKIPLAKAAPQLTRQALHAAKLELDHPATGERLAFEAPLPTDIAALLAWLRSEHASALR